MCERCDAIDTKISRYRRFASSGLDCLTIERINLLIQELKQRKSAVEH
jgi:hypothetical protein